MTYITYFLFFLLGVTFTKAFVFLTNIGLSVLILKGAEITALKIVVGVTEDMAFMRELKYVTLIKSGASEESLAMVKAIDDQTLKNWQESVIKKIIQTYPNSYRDQVAYGTWQEALRYLDTLSKKKRT